MPHDDIRIGTLCPATNGADYLRQIVAHGFESFQITFWQHIPDGLDLKTFAKSVQAALDESPNERRPFVSSLAVFGNPLEDRKTAQHWAKCIDACKWFGCDIVAGFAGCLTGKPVPDAMKTYAKVFGSLAKRADGKGVRIAFENCDMGGTWQAARYNIAHSPAAWEMMFDILPAKNVGLEWEPCHQMYSLVDPIANLRQWVHKVFHVHGKDATINWDVIRKYGTRGPKPCVQHRTPGFGDSNWTDIISILRMNGFKGSIDIEGWHDPVYRGELEMTGQVHGLKYLQGCRGGAFVPNPVVVKK